MELRESVLLQLAVLADEVGGDGDAEGARLVDLGNDLGHELAPICSTTSPDCLPNWQSYTEEHMRRTVENNLSVHVLPGAVGALGQADDHGHCLGLRGMGEHSR
jgi:hypothetical protein